MKRVYLTMAFAALLIVLSSATVLSINFQASTHPQFVIYKTTVPSVTLEYVTDIATRIFHMPKPSVEYRDGLYIVENEYPRYLQVYEASGSIWYADFSKIYNGSYAPNLPSKEEAKIIAERFLMEHGLMPKEAYFKGASYSTTAIFYQDNQEVETRLNGIHIIYGFRTSDGIEIEGPGAKIRVSIGEGGEIIGVHWAWRNIEPYEYRQGISESEAIKKFYEQSTLDVPVKLGVHFAYYSEPGFVTAEFLEPYYIFDYEVKVQGKPLVGETQKFSAILSTPTTSNNLPLNNVFAFSLPAFGVAVAGLVLVKKKERGVLASLLIIVVGMSVLITSTPIVSAQPNDDSLNTEVGIEWINAYPSYKGALRNRDDDARGFRNQLRAIGWRSRFDFGNGMALEQDFKYRNACGGGKDYMYIDSVDFAYFAGHGSVADPNDALIWFSSSVDYQPFNSNNARWGGTSGGLSTEAADLEWIVLDACLTLQASYKSSYDVFQRWDQAFCGLHYILGFHTVAFDTGRVGPRFGFYLCEGHTVEHAWIMSTQEVQPSSVWGAYLRAGRSDANTHLDKINPYSVSKDPYPVEYFAYGNWQC